MARSQTSIASEAKKKTTRAKKAKTSSKKAKLAKTEEAAPVETPVEAPVEAAPAENAPTESTPITEETTTTKTTRKRRVVDQASVMTDFDTIIASLEKEIDSARLSGDKAKISNIKATRATLKKIQRLKSDAARGFKQKRRTGNKKGNTTSGFMKPVKISGEMCKFTGWNPEELKSRVDVTKYICNYIREKDLQNPADRRQIRPDAELQKLLGLTKASLKETPLTYYTLQSVIQKHFK